ncbi:MAG TPA: hypothetical protein VG735_08005 [Caulobacterales bacterium]|nr:hypothetical protein [Caulobacterales bacterium]
MNRNPARERLLASMSLAAVIAASGRAFGMQQLNCDYPEIANIHPAILPVDLESGANNGIWISLKGYAGCCVVLHKKAGTAGDDPIFTLKQSTDVTNSQSDSKALTFTRVYSKLHATTVPGAWTLNTQAAAGTYTDDTSAEKSGIIAVDVKAEDLDQANGFDCLRLEIPDTGSAGAELAGAVYILYGPKHSGIAAQLSPIAN